MRITKKNFVSFSLMGPLAANIESGAAHFADDDYYNRGIYRRLLQKSPSKVRFFDRVGGAHWKESASGT